MNLCTRFERAQERDSIIRAIQSFDVKELSSLIADGADVKRLANDKKLVWHLQKNFLPEADNLEVCNDSEREQLQEISQRLAKGNKIIKILIKAGVFGEDYSQYSLYELEENNSEASKNVSEFGLWQAVSPEALKSMLTQSADVNFTDNSGLTALHHIALAPNGKYFRPVEMVKILLEAGADINALSNDKITPLMLALKGLAENINHSWYDDYYTNNIKSVALMTKHGAKAKDIKHWADINSNKARNAYESFIGEIEAYPHMNELEFDFLTAVFSNDFQAVKEIISRNPDLNINLQTISGYTPLMFALKSDNDDLLRFLLEHGANPNIQNLHGESSLLYAISEDSENKRIELLLDNGADPNIKDIRGYTALNLICKNSLDDRDLLTVKLLLEHGADPNSQDKDGITPLMDCVSHYNSDSNDGNIILAMKFLIEAGADVNARDNNGTTPLMYAASVNDKFQINVIKSLLANGADPSIRNNDGNSALDIILNHDDGDEPSNLEAVILLIQQGVYLNDNETHFKSKFIEFGEDKAFDEVKTFGLNEGETFVEVIQNNTTEDLIRAVNNGFNMSIHDKSGISFPEAAIEARELELLKACLRTGERDNDYTVQDIFEGLLVILMNKYDVEGVKFLLQAGVDTESIKTFAWHFVRNYVPEADKSEDAKNFKLKLDKGTEILNILHEVEPTIPNRDFDGKELSYTNVTRFYEKDWSSELLPLKNHTINRVRHAASYEALSELLSSCPDLDLNTDLTEYEALDNDSEQNEYDENESFEEVTREMSIKFSPEDFVTRSDEEEIEDRLDDLKFLDSLLENKNFGKSILHLIAANPREYFEPAKMIRLLCEKGADVNMRTIDGITPIIMFIKNISREEKYSHVNLECLCELIRAGADLELKDEEHFSFKKFLEDENYTNNGKFRKNICYGTRFVKVLMFIDILNTIIDNTDFHDVDLLVASFGKDMNKISDALSDYADIEAKTQKGYTALMIASMFGTPETVKFLIENGADINAKDMFGNNIVALSVIAGEKNQDVICVLAEAGANINSKNMDDLTPIVQAVMNYSNYGAKLEKLKTLLALGADPKIKPKQGKFALNIAAENGMYLVVKEFLRAGVNPENLYNR